MNFVKWYDIYIYVDEVYKGVEFDGNELFSFVDEYEKVIIICGLLKVMVMFGLCLGWLVGLFDDIYKMW